MDILDVKSENDIQLNARSKDFILETAKWAKFLSIVGFVMIGLMALAGIVSLFIATASPFARITGGGGPFVIFLVYLIMGALYFFPVLYLYKAATGLKNGINNMNDEQITSGFENLKSHYKFVGIFMIVILSLYALAFILALLGGAMIGAIR